MMEPMRNSTMALQNTVREPQRSATWPLTGVKMARLRR